MGIKRALRLSSVAIGGIVSARREAAIEHDVPIEQRSCRIHQRILLIVAFHQHGIETRDAAGDRSARRVPEVAPEG